MVTKRPSRFLNCFYFRNDAIWRKLVPFLTRSEVLCPVLQKYVVFFRQGNQWVESGAVSFSVWSYWKVKEISLWLNALGSDKPAPRSTSKLFLAIGMTLLQYSVCCWMFLSSNKPGGQRSKLLPRIIWEQVFVLLYPVNHFTAVFTITRAFLCRYGAWPNATAILYRLDPAYGKLANKTSFKPKYIVTCGASRASANWEVSASFASLTICRRNFYSCICSCSSWSYVVAAVQNSFGRVCSFRKLIIYGTNLNMEARASLATNKGLHLEYKLETSVEGCICTLSRMKNCFTANLLFCS